MIASLDGQFDDGSILEIKNLCESKHLSILQLETKSPEFRYYYWQVQHQLLTTGAPQAYLVFWSATDQTKVFKIMPSKKAFYRVQLPANTSGIRFRQKQLYRLIRKKIFCLSLTLKSCLRHKALSFQTTSKLVW